MTIETQAMFQSNPAGTIEQEIKRFILDHPDNLLKDIDGSPIFEEPLVGFADGEDHLFRTYKEIIGESHLTPREIMVEHLKMSPGACSRTSDLSVVCWTLPVASKVRLAQGHMEDGPSLHWNHTRWYGQALNDLLAKHVVAFLQGQGYQAMAPDQAPFFAIKQIPDGRRISNWSHRHAAYVAGLGTFSLNDALITPKGIAHRCNSVVTDLKLPVSIRPYASYVANCPFLVNGSCGACITRCPSGAISAKGHDKVKCFENLSVTQNPWLSKPGYIGRYAGCGLCQTGVPCEDKIPPL